LQVSEAASAYDPQSDTLVYYGGLTAAKHDGKLRILVPKFNDDKTLKGYGLTVVPTMGDHPPALRGASLVISGPQAFLFGGVDMSNNLPSSDLFAVDLEGPSAFKWRRVELNLAPASRYGHSMTALPAHGSRVSIVVFGGSDGMAALSDVWHLSGVGPALRWERVRPRLAPGANLPTPRYAHSAALASDGYNDKLIVYGGCDALRRACYDSVEILNTLTWSWEPVPVSLPGSALPALAAPVAGTEAIVDTDTLAARMRSPQARGGSTMVVLPNARAQRRARDLVQARRRALQRRKDNGESVSDSEEVAISADSASAGTIVRGYRLAVVMGCSGLQCASTDARVVSVLDTDAVCPISCARDRGVFVEERGGGTSVGVDMGAHDLDYAPAHCRCHPYYHGRFCELHHDCPNGCSGHGKCVVEEDDEGASVMFCKCQPGFWGLDCSLRACENNCSGRGVCMPGADPVFKPAAQPLDAQGAPSHCKCRKGFYGADCALILSAASSVTCPGDCSGHGVCASDGTCQCDAGFTGSRCEKQCPNMCSNNGVCLQGDASAIVTDDALKQEDGLYIGASGAGSGDDAVCQCKKGWSGRDCATRYCAHNCHGRGTCGKDGVCACQAGWGGEFCSIPTDCSGHGKYVVTEPAARSSAVAALLPAQRGHGECQCDRGWGNPVCSQRVFCPHSCSGNGECVLMPPVSPTSLLLQRPVGRDAFAAQHLGGIIPTVDSPEASVDDTVLFESDGHSLLDVASLAAAPVLGKTGRSNIEIEGICRCAKGWRGADCSKRECATPCRDGRGECDDLGDCQCYPGYTGPDCGLAVPCPGNCTSAFHGFCNDNGSCKCQPGWNGPDCGQRTCPKDCSGNGDCDNVSGHCDCKPGFFGPDCSKSCTNKCSGKGSCVDGICRCDPGFTGEDCSLEAHCPRNAFLHPNLDCSGHGFCFRPSRKCICEPGYTGRDCSQDDGSCGQGSCGNHGTCRHGQCYCDLGWSGKHCELQNQCPHNCNNHGFCVHGTCHCFAGFDGDSCDVAIMDQGCPADCSGNGFCLQGKCTCVEGYGGDDCAQLKGFCAETDCSSNGVCRFGKCRCNPGFHGEHCEKSGCDKCVEGKGVCVLGECQCLPGFRGHDCSEQDLCPNGCSSHGMCILGTCACLPGYTGKDCSVVRLEENALTHEPTPAANATCLHDCGGKGVCHLGKCFCVDGYTGEDCSELKPHVCPNNCGGHAPTYDQRGDCRFGKCFCKLGFEGAGCEVELHCPDKCELNGICMHGKCFCAPGWAGADCQQALSPEEKDKLFSNDISPSAPKVTAPATNTTANATRAANDTHAASKPAALVEELVLLQLGQDAEAAAPQDMPSYGEEEEEIVEELLLDGESDGSLLATDGEAVEVLEEQELNEEQFKQQQQAFSEHNAKQAALLAEEAAVSATPAPAPAPKSKNATVAPKQCIGGCEHGICVKDQCLCQPGYAGPRCDVVVPAKQWERCPHNCHGKGTCVQGQCFCDIGYAGDDCAQAQALPCPVDCSGHGVCHNGRCFCEPGFEGAACAVITSCRNKCGVHGVCFRGMCVCAKGFTGADCNTAIDPDELPEAVAKSIYASDDDLSMLRMTNLEIEDQDEVTSFVAQHKNDKNVTETVMVATSGSFLDVGDQIMNELTQVADAHAFACSAGCGTHGRCIEGTCYCEPNYAGAICEIKLDEKALANLEAAQSAGMVMEQEGEGLNKQGMSPLLLATLAFVVGVLAMTMLRGMSRAEEMRKNE
jgi:hypothetical protein